MISPLMDGIGMPEQADRGVVEMSLRAAFAPLVGRFNTPGAVREANERAIWELCGGLRVVDSREVVDGELRITYQVKRGVLEELHR